MEARAFQDAVHDFNMRLPMGMILCTSGHSLFRLSNVYILYFFFFQFDQTQECEDPFYGFGTHLIILFITFPLHSTKLVIASFLLKIQTCIAHPSLCGCNCWLAAQLRLQTGRLLFPAAYESVNVTVGMKSTPGGASSAPTEGSSSVGVVFT